MERTLPQLGITLLLLNVSCPKHSIALIFSSTASQCSNSSQCWCLLSCRALRCLLTVRRQSLSSMAILPTDVCYPRQLLVNASPLMTTYTIPRSRFPLKLYMIPKRHPFEFRVIIGFRWLPNACIGYIYLLVTPSGNTHFPFTPSQLDRYRPNFNIQ